ncbi:peptidoglycan-binding protein [Streptomyces sp. NPDC060232]|uniref:peptidoglycan-binding domain-containing protein n=1 Tax=Streptomyces sp. NPDC060232 TaxID=3347079 RepID=UPI003660CF2D
MSQDPDESGLVAADDALFVRPYVGPSGPPPRAAAPPWPQSGPFAFPGPAHGPSRSPSQGLDGGVAAPVTVPAAAPAAATRGVGPSGAAGRRSRLPLTVATVLALTAVGALVLLLTGPDPQPPRAEPPADLSVPALPGGAHAVTESPGATPSARSADPSARASATAAPTSPGPKPPTTPSASAPRPSNAYVTLRMGDRGPEVRALQEMLYRQGFTYVSVTGVYDGQTKRGVGQLQRDRSITGDPQGVYGPNTQAAMG